MVQRKAPNKLGIKTKPHHLISSAHFEPHNLNKTMKKQPAPPSKKTSSPEKQSPNYMKSTTSFENKSPAVKKRNLMASSLKTSTPLKKCSMLCQDLDAQRATCSSTLKESKFPSYLQLSPGGTELTGASEVKVCPYAYCSLNGHHHAQAPPLKSFLSARRRVMKTQKSFKLGCLSPRQTKPKTKPVLKEHKETASLVKEENKNKDFFIEIYSNDKDLECSDMDWEAEGDVREDQVLKEGVESFYGGHEESYDEESLSYGDYESDGSYEQSKDQSLNDELDDKIVSVCKNAIFEVKKDELQGLNLETGDQDIKCSIDYEEETCRESKSLPDSEEHSQKQQHQTRIYNIIQFNISVFINGVKRGDLKTGKGVLEVPVTDVASEEKVSDSIEEQVTKNDSEKEVSDLSQTVVEKQDDLEKDSLDQEHTSISNENLAICKEGFSAKSLRGCEKLDEGVEGLKDFNPRGPNFLPEVVDPDGEKVDLRHQMMDERRNSEEWMVDFALRQAVTTLAPERKRKVALLVEAFEKVAPIPKCESYEGRGTKAFMNARPMQACS